MQANATCSSDLPNFFNVTINEINNFSFNIIKRFAIFHRGFIFEI